jgi:hypothetical protein
MADSVTFEEAIAALLALRQAQPSESPIWECDRWQAAIDLADDVLERAEGVGQSL